MSQARNNIDRSGLVRPLTARSVIASTLLGMNPPRLSAAALVASGELFGVAPGTTRVALSRMVESGELTIVDEATYALAGPLLERQSRQEQGRHPRTTRWTGAWRIAVVGGEARSAAARAALRVAMGQMRMVELRAGVWVRPDNLPATDDQCSWFTGQPDRELDIDDLFGLTSWAGVARELLAELRASHAKLAARDASALGDTFVIAAATTRHLTLDPLLPAQLLPADWPGADLRAAYDDYQAAFAATWRAWYRSRVGNLRA